MKQLSEDKRLRLDKLELLTYDIEVGNTHRVRKVKGTNLNAAFLLGELSDNRRTMLVRQAENDRTPVSIDGFLPSDFRVKREFLDELARMVSIHVTANFLTKPNTEAA